MTEIKNFNDCLEDNVGDVCEVLFGSDHSEDYPFFNSLLQIIKMQNIKINKTTIRDLEEKNA